MKYMVNNTLKEVTLRIWEGTRYGEDIFADLEAHNLINAINDGNYDEENEAIIISEKDFEKFVSYYENNEGGEISEEFEYMVDVNEILL